MAKIKTDYISWTLQLKADGVQKEIHKITEANQELKESNKSLRKEMRDLVNGLQKLEKDLGV